VKSNSETGEREAALGRLNIHITDKTVKTVINLNYLSIMSPC